MSVLQQQPISNEENLKVFWASGRPVCCNHPATVKQHKRQRHKPVSQGAEGTAPLSSCISSWSTADCISLPKRPPIDTCSEALPGLVSDRHASPLDPQRTGLCRLQRKEHRQFPQRPSLACERLGAASPPLGPVVDLVLTGR